MYYINHASSMCIYVPDFRGHCIVVYETSGQFVTSFGRRGFIHVCDLGISVLAVHLCVAPINVPPVPRPSL